MALQTLSQKMLDCFTQLDDAEQQSVLQFLKTFMRNRKPIESPQTIEKYSAELEAADAEIERGEFVSHKEVMMRYPKP